MVSSGMLSPSKGETKFPENQTGDDVEDSRVNDDSNGGTSVGNATKADELKQQIDVMKSSEVLCSSSGSSTFSGSKSESFCSSSHISESLQNVSSSSEIQGKDFTSSEKFTTGSATQPVIPPPVDNVTVSQGLSESKKTVNISQNDQLHASQTNLENDKLVSMKSLEVNQHLVDESQVIGSSVAPMNRDIITSTTEKAASASEFVIEKCNSDLNTEASSVLLQKMPQAGIAVDPVLFEAVKVQIAQVYPSFATDPAVLDSIALQQTMVLQACVASSGAPGPSKTLPVVNSNTHMSTLQTEPHSEVRSDDQMKDTSSCVQKKSPERFQEITIPHSTNGAIPKTSLSSSKNPPHVQLSNSCQMSVNTTNQQPVTLPHSAPGPVNATNPPPLRLDSIQDAGTSKSHAPLNIPISLPSSIQNGHPDPVNICAPYSNQNLGVFASAPPVKVSSSLQDCGVTKIPPPLNLSSFNQKSGITGYPASLNLPSCHQNPGIFANPPPVKVSSSMPTCGVTKCPPPLNLPTSHHNSGISPNPPAGNLTGITIHPTFVTFPNSNQNPGAAINPSPMNSNNSYQNSGITIHPPISYQNYPGIPIIPSPVNLPNPSLKQGKVINPLPVKVSNSFGNPGIPANPLPARIPLAKDYERHLVGFKETSIPPPGLGDRPIISSKSMMSPEDGSISASVQHNLHLKHGTTFDLSDVDKQLRTILNTQSADNPSQMITEPPGLKLGNLSHSVVNSSKFVNSHTPTQSQPEATSFYTKASSVESASIKGSVPQHLGKKDTQAYSHPKEVKENKKEIGMDWISAKIDSINLSSDTSEKQATLKGDKNGKQKMDSKIESLNLDELDDDEEDENKEFELKSPESQEVFNQWQKPLQTRREKTPPPDDGKPDPPGMQKLGSVGHTKRTPLERGALRDWPRKDPQGNHVLTSA